MTYDQGLHYIAWDLTGAVLLAVGVLIYFLPTIVAAMRKAARIGAVFTVNLLLGWTLLGWLVALVMAVIMENTWERQMRIAHMQAVLRMSGGPWPDRIHR